eukprot:GHVN01068069.1.p2 GENE.GHVN01068069.1~~GHVN01068069.1.p2  ORF type:complete len:109 (+),score=12.41 GHVN01068069.1:222-548(+)
MDVSRGRHAGKYPPEGRRSILSCLHPRDQGGTREQPCGARRHGERKCSRDEDDPSAELPSDPSTRLREAQLPRPTPPPHPIRSKGHPPTTKCARAQDRDQPPLQPTGM